MASGIASIPAIPLAQMPGRLLLIVLWLAEEQHQTVEKSLLPPMMMHGCPPPPHTHTHTHTYAHMHTQDDTTVVTVPHLGLTGATEQMSAEEVQKRLHLKAEELKSDTHLTEVRGHHHSNHNFLGFSLLLSSSWPFHPYLPSLTLLSLLLCRKSERSV